MRPSWIEIDLDAIEHNARVMAAHVAPAALCAVVKADAYGHGDVPVAEAAMRGGAEILAVALVEEGVRLREADVDAPILVLSEPTLDEVDVVVANALAPTAYRIEFVDALAEAAESAGTVPYPVHLKLDTGMHRVGARSVEAFEVARRIADEDRLTLQGLFTHFPVADTDQEFTLQQNEAMLEFVEELAASGIEPKLLHAANTAAAIDLPETRHAMCRVGLGLYGMLPSPDIGADLGLRPAMKVVSHVTYTRRLPAGARPSYGRVRELDGSHNVATIPIGYADGIPRNLTGVAEVLINGKRYPYAGTVTMDMVIVDIGDDEVEEGDEVVFIGAQGEESITADDWAALLGTINWEVVCHFGPRLPRRYMRSRGG